MPIKMLSQMLKLMVFFTAKYISFVIYVIHLTDLYCMNEITLTGVWM